MHPRVAAAAVLVVVATIAVILLPRSEDAARPGKRGGGALVRPATAAERATCRRENDGKRVRFACPRAVPTPGGFERARQYATDRCESLVNFEPRRARTSSGSVFHMLVATRCGPVSLRTASGRWPVEVPVSNDMRLIGSRAPTSPSERPSAVRLTVLRRTEINGGRALLLRNSPYPDGGIHGGHLTVITVTPTATRAVTGHPPIPSHLRDEAGELEPAALARVPRILPHERRAVAQLMAVATTLE